MNFSLSYRTGIEYKLHRSTIIGKNQRMKNNTSLNFIDWTAIIRRISRKNVLTLPRTALNLPVIILPSAQALLILLRSVVSAEGVSLLISATIQSELISHPSDKNKDVCLKPLSPSLLQDVWKQYNSHHRPHSGQKKPGSQFCTTIPWDPIDFFHRQWILSA